jgi:hypothetical protein
MSMAARPTIFPATGGVHVFTDAGAVPRCSDGERAIETYRCIRPEWPEVVAEGRRNCRRFQWAGTGASKWFVRRGGFHIQPRYAYTARNRVRFRHNQLHIIDGGGAEPGNYDPDRDLRQRPILWYPAI